MPKVHGILETALSIADPQKSAKFYRQLFDFSVLLESERLVALNVAERNVLLLFQKGGTNGSVSTAGGVIPGHAGIGMSHLAFAIGADEFESWQERVQELGIAIESVVTWPGGAKSLYFRDLDEHLVELMTPGFWQLHEH